MFRELYPAPGDGKAISARLHARAHSLMGSKSDQEWPVGFFLLGMAWAAEGRRGYA